MKTDNIENLSSQIIGSLKSTGHLFSKDEEDLIIAAMRLAHCYGEGNGIDIASGHVHTALDRASK